MILRPNNVQRHNVLRTSRAKRIDPYSCNDRTCARKSETRPYDGIVEGADGGISSISSSSRRIGWYSVLAKDLEIRWETQGTRRVSRRMMSDATTKMGRKNKVCLKRKGAGLLINQTKNREGARQH